MEYLNVLMAVVSIILGVVSIVISLKAQKVSNMINQETEKKLIEIKNVNDNITKTADRIEGNLKTQIDRIINSNAPTQDEKIQQQLLGTILPEIIKDPKMLKTLMDMEKNKN